MYNAINMVGYILMDKMNSCPPKKKNHHHPSKHGLNLKKTKNLIMIIERCYWRANNNNSDHVNRQIE